MLRLTWKRDRWSRSLRRRALHRRRQEDGGESGLLLEASGKWSGGVDGFLSDAACGRGGAMEREPIRDGAVMQ